MSQLQAEGFLRPESLLRLHWDMARFMAVRFQDEVAADDKTAFYHLMFCGGTACNASKGQDFLRRLKEEADRRALGDKVLAFETGCIGFCAQGPVMTVYPGGIFYVTLRPEDAGRIIDEHLLGGKPVQDLMYRDPATNEPVQRMKDIPFFARQTSRVLRNRGRLSAEDIREYIGAEGYLAAMKALLGMAPEEIIREVKTAGIRGRGGAGFPTGLKWEFAARAKSDVKYILCNADEGDPGAFMDASVLESDPHSVLEGMLIAAKAIGARQGYIYCRAEYPLAVRRLTIALAQARESGLLGTDILGSGFDFDLELYRGAGAFVCGEETALMTSIEGKRGTPRPRPPFPAVQGLWKKPSVLNNVETLSSIPQIVLNGGAWYAGVGSPRSRGTKIFSVTGDVRDVGLVEVPMGAPIGDIIFDVAGGMSKGKKFKAVQLGGPSGGCVPARHLGAAMDYESIARLGAIVGSGGMIVMDEDKCMVDVARFFMDFCVDESCGKCVPCRVGTRQMLRILTRITEGQGAPQDLDRLERWARVVQNGSLCGLGQTAPNPVLSTLRYFRHEYEAHINEKRCPAVVCASLFEAPCVHTCPMGMDVPAYVALAKAGRYDDAYRVMLRTNPFPSVCGRVCEHPCEAKCRRGSLDQPVSVRLLKRFITDAAARPKEESPGITRLEKIAVAGAGPSGLTAARDLALRGYAVTVFEQLPEPGGMLRYGIPAYRLPRPVLRAEIQAIVDLGVQIRCGQAIGDSLPWRTLIAEHDAVYLAVGAHHSLPLDVEGEDYLGVVGAVEFLRQVNMGRRPHVGRHPVIVGGGNSAVDAARTVARLGAEKVTILYRRRREDMPAQKEEIRAALDEGIDLRELVAPARILGHNGRVSQMICRQMTLGDFDSGGRRRPIPLPGAEFTLTVDQVIAAVGQRPVLGFLEDRDGTGVNVTDEGLILVTHRSSTRVGPTMVFAGGDAVTGPSTVAWAISAGRRAAREIDDALRKRKGDPPYVEPELGIEIPSQVDEETKETPRCPALEADAAERVRSFMEVERGLPPEGARAEASRCLRCDVKQVS